MGWTSRERRWLAALLVLAAGLRILAWLRTVAIFDDGPLFIYIAEAMAAGDWQGVFLHPYHPLYSAAVAVMSSLTGDFESAAVVVSIAAGTAAVALLYAFLRDTFDPRTALVGATILAIHPHFVDLTSDVQSDGLYMALLLGALVLLWRALDRASVAHAFGTGLVGGAAYLTRPEGLGVVLLGGMAALVLVLRREWRPARAAAWTALLLFGLAIPMAPYVGAIHAETDQWRLTQKKSVLAMAGIQVFPSANSSNRRVHLFKLSKTTTN